jgi:hypothetical protein
LSRMSERRARRWKANNKNKKFWEELIAYLPLIRHSLQIKRTAGGHTDSKVIS